MNIVLWIVAGASVALIAFAVLRLNGARGLIFSLAIGMLGAVFGGYVLAPLFGTPIVEPGVLSPFALLVAAASALGCLSLVDMTYRRLGF